jgi:hypothetical protein
LRPYSLLARYRPVRLGVVARQLRNAGRSMRVMRLIERHFPQAVRPAFSEAASIEGWLYLMREFLDMVDEQWFEIDWELLDGLYEAAQSVGWDDDDNEPEGIRMMADLLVRIPHRSVRPGREDLENDESLSAVQMVAAVQDEIVTSYDMMEIIWEVGEMPGEEPDDLYEARDRLWYGDWSDFEPPLCHIPVVAEIVAGETGNPFLDAEAGWRRIYDEWDMMYEWDCPDDVEKLRRAWPEAQGRIEAYEEFVRWAADYEHFDDRLRAVSRALFYGERKWRSND